MEHEEFLEFIEKVVTGLMDSDKKNLVGYEQKYIEGRHDAFLDVLEALGIETNQTPYNYSSIWDKSE